ncbi:hypothetical protein GA0116948_12514 [Chitinophaga costaii]|uniref:Uncharacterized protein n=1 Tax=Chitinophaga costaii TaxID=1335309 RepID=A0A1C4G6P8_9BACT|nr:hypothetical protein [Chitinophaga costaii]PUZ19590.1 hypothetical protein DCM91_20365 [Chitinophaga costaii]SCC63860.1 hypothetical protein GA0116948_12514 [Chitinophaga costaii]
MKDTNYISEKYRKYLLEVVFEEQKYYTVFGADLSDNEIDKLLVDTDGNILLFPLPHDLFSSIQNRTTFFDNDMLKKWAIEAFDFEKPYAVINLDILSKNTFYLNDVQLLKSIYGTLGIIEDYAYQIGDKSLLALMEKDVLLQFQDSLSDYFIWSENKALKIPVDANILYLSLKEVYERVKEKLYIYQ